MTQDDASSKWANPITYYVWCWLTQELQDRTFVEILALASDEIDVVPALYCRLMRSLPRAMSRPPLGAFAVAAVESVDFAQIIRRLKTMYANGIDIGAQLPTRFTEQESPGDSKPL